MTKKMRNHLATILGVATSVCTAWAVVDFDTIDFNNPKTYVKLVVIAVPAVGGYVSIIKGKEDKQTN